MADQTERRNREPAPDVPSNYMHRFVKPDPGDFGPYCMFCGEHRDHFAHPKSSEEQPLHDTEDQP